MRAARFAQLPMKEATMIIHLADFGEILIPDQFVIIVLLGIITGLIRLRKPPE